MRLKSIWLTLITLLLLCPISPAAETGKDGFAVVELFTSEGCSSCPPADELLSQLTENARAHNQKVYTLGFHVDYWNRLGWKDPFSHEFYSVRQRQYARVFKSDRIYTPQMIVNGTKVFLGSDKNLANKTIQQALQTPAAAGIQLNAQFAQKTIKIKYTLTGAPAESLINLVLVEGNLKSKITRGENAGRTLIHQSVVRLFQSMPVNSPSAEVTLTLDFPIHPQNSTLIAYLQNPETMQIIAASKTDLAASNLP